MENNELEFVAIIVARLSSHRLPKKNILPIVDKPMIELLIERVSKAKNINKVVIATSNLPSDDQLEEIANNIGVSCYRGSLENVMERIVLAADKFKAKNIVEILGDNPLVHSDIIDDVIDLYKHDSSDYAANITSEYGIVGKNLIKFSVGLRVQVYKSEVASRFREYPAWISGDKHPSSFIFENPLDFNLSFLEAKSKWSFLNRPHLNFAVNYHKNFKFIKEVFELNYKDCSNFSLDKVIQQLDSDSDLHTLLGPE